MNTKRFLFLLLLMTGIISTTSYSSSNYTAIPENLLVEELKKMNEHIESYQKEISSYGSNSPAITNTRIGIVITVLSLLGYVYLATEINDKEIMNQIATACNVGVFTGIAISFGSGITSDAIVSKLSNQHERMVREKNEVLKAFLVKKEDRIL